MTAAPVQTLRSRHWLQRKDARRTQQKGERAKAFLINFSSAGVSL